MRALSESKLGVPKEGHEKPERPRWLEGHEERGTGVRARYVLPYRRFCDEWVGKWLKDCEQEHHVI